MSTMESSGQQTLPDISPLEKVVRGYTLFREADPDDDAFWGVDSPLAEALADGIRWRDEDRQEDNFFEGKQRVLEHLREVRRRMSVCTLLHAGDIQDRVLGEWVHTLDRMNDTGDPHAEHEDHLCMDVFKFEGGLITEAHHCAVELPPHP